MELFFFPNRLLSFFSLTSGGGGGILPRILFPRLPRRLVHTPTLTKLFRENRPVVEDLLFLSFHPRHLRRLSFFLRFRFLWVIRPLYAHPCVLSMIRVIVLLMVQVIVLLTNQSAAPLTVPSMDPSIAPSMDLPTAPSIVPSHIYAVALVVSLSPQLPARAPRALRITPPLLTHA